MVSQDRIGRLLSTATSVPSEVDDERLTHVHIEPSQGWVSLKLRELWEYRELLYFLVWRDVKVRYKQTVMGAAWAIIQPFFTMVVFSIFFGRLAGIPSDDIPYPIFSYAALVPWSFFANGLRQASTGMVTHANLIKKVYFPRLAIPIASVLAPGPHHLSGDCPLVCRDERPVSGRAVRRSFHHAVLDVHHAHCLLQ
jgi:hypothetical protein